MSNVVGRRKKMKKKFLLVILIIFVICLVPKVETCKCGGTTIKSLIYRIEKDNIDLSGVYEYDIDIFGINIYRSNHEIK